MILKTKHFLLLTILLVLSLPLFATDLHPIDIEIDPPSSTAYIGADPVIFFKVRNDSVVTANANEWVVTVNVRDPNGSVVYTEQFNGQTLTPYTQTGVKQTTGPIPINQGGTYTIQIIVNYQFDVKPGNNEQIVEYYVWGQPDGVTSITPANGATDVPFSPPPTIGWENGNTPYDETRVFLGPTPEDADPLIGTVLTATVDPINSFTPPNDLDPGTTIYWSVQQENPAGTTDNGPFTFMTEESPCPQSAPLITYPTDGATGIFDYPNTLTWQNPETGEWTQIDILLGTSEEDVNPEVATPYTSTLSTSSSFTFERGDLEPNTQYFTRVGLICDGGSIYSEVTDFTTGSICGAPAPPIITSPQDGETDVLLNPTTITWTNPDGTWNNTEIYISPTLEGVDPNFASPVTNTISPDQSFFNVPSTLLEENTNYYLRVGLICSDGAIFSDPQTFETGDVLCPGPVDVLMPGSGATNFPFDPVPIEIEALSLTSTEPITVQIFLDKTLDGVDPLLSSPRISTTDTETTKFLLDEPLDPGTNYYIRTVLECSDNLIIGDINQFSTAPPSSVSGKTVKVYGGTSTDEFPIEMVELNLMGSIPFPNGDVHEIESTVNSDENGNYTFESLSSGDFQINVSPPEGWTIESPQDSFFDVFVEIGTDVNDLDFLLIPPPSELIGEKWQDDGDGEKEPGEPLLPDWPITITGTSFAGNEVNLSTTTNESGVYQFSEIHPGNYTITEGEVEGWTQVYPSGGAGHDVTPDNGSLINELDFGNTPPGGSIHGQKFFDQDKNGSFDETEVGINGWVIQLYMGDQLIAEQETHAMDENNDEVLNPYSEFGWYWFTGLQPGSYTVKEVLIDGWEQTAPAQNEYNVTLQAGQVINNLNFGNFNEFLDWGDLPEPADTTFGPCPAGWQCYPTLPPNGARHVAVGARLGSLRDAEPTGMPSDFANGDDTLNVDDEDGVEFLKFLPGVSGEVEVTVSGAPADFPTILAAWIDFDADGTFNNFTEELIIVDTIAAPGTYPYSFDIPDLIEGAGYARFRLGTDIMSLFGPLWDGLSKNGEVEDYVGLGFDYGDANDQIDNDHPYFPGGYPVRLVDDGARHIPTPTTMLGSVITDKDNDGQPGIYSTGDNNYDRDDEDGILMVDGYQIVYDGPDPDNPNNNLTVIGITQGTDVSFKPLATRSGFFNAWYDFNGDGDWADPGEQVFDDEPVLSGPDYTTLTFTVPTDAEVGWSYYRVRFSTVMNLEITGPAKDGEVEDYLFAVLPALDFGDSPDPYATLFADNGAMHSLSDWYLGSLIDSEFDGLPEPDALGDDNDNLADEDGINLVSKLSAGDSTDIEVTSNVPSSMSGYLSIWIDLDRDGVWSSSEQLIVDEELFGGMDTLTVSIPESIEPGKTFMRVRFSNNSGIGPVEEFTFPSAILINEGEVEDYLVEIDSLVTSVKSNTDYMPTEFNLYQNYPNPFNPSTIIRYDVKEPVHVRLDLYNILGQRITTLIDEMQSAGAYEAMFDASNLSAGIYFYTIRMGDFATTRKMILMK